ncbi:MAG TPA: hypothetical protein VNM16_02675 [Bacillota bacterium]|nr:hypothetical protein [Bacillota bacterium]
MGAFFGHVLGGLGSLAAAALPRGAGPADPFLDFGPTWVVVIALDVINTVAVLIYLYRILSEKPPTSRPAHR